MEAKDELIQGFRAQMLSMTSFTEAQISHVESILHVAMADYDVTRQERALVAYDYTDVEFIQKFVLAKAVEGLSKTSIKTYSSIYKKFFGETGKHIKDVETEDVRVYLAKLKIAGASTNYLNLIKRALSSLYQWLVEEDFLPKNPVARIKTIKNTKVVRQPLTDDEMELLRSACTTRRNVAIFDFLYSTGCRVSEMCALDIEDVDLEKKEAIVLGKGDKERVVYLSARAAVSLKAYLMTRKDKCPALFVSEAERMIGYWQRPEAERPVPERLKKSGVEIMCRKLGKKVGIDNVHPHRFRRTAATNALRRGMPLEQVSKMLGHANITVTTIYASSTHDEIKEQHNKFIV